MIGSFSHLQHPATQTTKEQSANKIAIFFMISFLVFKRGEIFAPYFYNGILTASTISEINSDNGLTDWPSLPK